MASRTLETGSAGLVTLVVVLLLLLSGTSHYCVLGQRCRKRSFFSSVESLVISDSDFSLNFTFSDRSLDDVCF